MSEESKPQKNEYHKATKTETNKHVNNVHCITTGMIIFENCTILNLRKIFKPDSAIQIRWWFGLENFPHYMQKLDVHVRCVCIIPETFGK